VLVAPGTYLERIDFIGKNIVVTSEWMNTPHDCTAILNTIIDAGGVGSVVTMANGETEAAICQGFTLTGGHGTQHQIGTCDYQVGGGVFLYGVSGTIKKNRIIDNYTMDGGAGLFIDEGVPPGAAPQILENTIVENTTGVVGCGGGILCMNVNDGKIEWNYVENNTAHSGGGISLKHTTISVCRNIIHHNTATGDGGGVRIYSQANPELINNTISHNTTLAMAGGGIIVMDGSAPVIMNNIISYVTNGCGIVVWGISSPQLSYNLFHSNTGGNYFMVSPGVGDLTGDPHFVGGTPYDYHLADSLSAAYNAGNPDPAYNDPDGTRNDCGAFFYPYLGVPMPIALLNFQATVEDRAVTLSWTTASEINTYGWVVQRRQGTEAYSSLNSETPVLSQGISLVSNDYSYQDLTAEVGQTYLYRLMQVDLDGSLSYSNELTVTVGSADLARVSIQRNYPNPFNPQTTIEYSLPIATWAKISIFDATGKLVTELASGYQTAGQHSIVWNAHNLPSGLYLCRLETPEQSSAKLLVLVK